MTYGVENLDPCPICGTVSTYVHYVATEPEAIGYIADLGWRAVYITEHPTPTLTHWLPTLTHWLLDPCGCILPVTHWGWLSLPGESIHWLHPDEIDRRLNDWRNTGTT